MTFSPFGFREDLENGGIDLSKIDIASIGRGYKVVTKRPTPDNPVWGRNRSHNPVLESAATRRKIQAMKSDGAVLIPQIVETEVSKALNLSDPLDYATQIKFRKSLAANVESMRALLVQEIAPVMFALETAHEAATGDLRQITGDENLEIDISGLQGPLFKAVRIRMVKHLASLMQVHPSLLLSEFSKDVTIETLKKLLDSPG